MLSGTLENLPDCPFPTLVTPKLDGIRCLVINGKVLSRTFKDIPNRYIQNMMANLTDGLDGELMVPGATFNQVQSAVMSEDGEPDFRYHIFDYVTTSLAEPYCDRVAKLKNLTLPSFCVKVLPTLVATTVELEAFEAKCLANGFEGVMVRSVQGPYKCGRSSLKQGYLLKIKRFADSEAVVIGFQEQMRNDNEAEEDAFGRTKRSKAQDGMVLAGTLGKFLVREMGNTPWQDKDFAVGTGKGLTHELRQEIWDNQDKYIGKIITYKFQPHGTKDLPRIPIWKSFRSVIDIGEPE